MPLVLPPSSLHLPGGPRPAPPKQTLGETKLGGTSGSPLLQGFSPWDTYSAPTLCRAPGMDSPPGGFVSPREVGAGGLRPERGSTLPHLRPVTVGHAPRGRAG